VTVRPKPAPTCTLNATPYYVEYGGDVHLSWSTENADEVTLSGFGDVNEDGSDTDEDVTSNTTYTLTVRGNGKTVTCTDSVIVKQQPAAPTCSLNAKPYWIEHGGDVEIEWTTTNASEVTLSGFGTVSKNGSDTDENVTSDKTYTLTVKGNGKTVTCTDSVKVKPVVTPACTLTASKTTINKGESVTLNWTSTNAHSADITTIGDIPVNGSRVMYPTENFTYHADFHGHNNQDVRCSVTVTVITPTPTAPVCNIYINNYNQYTYGQPVVINWTSSNAVTGWINNGIGHVSLTGSRTVYPQNGNTTYTATFANEHGQSVTCSVIVNMAPQVPYVTLSQTPYTGLELGPMGTAAYWAFLVLWCLYAAYLIAVKRVHMSIYRWYSKVLFGDTVVMAPVARQTFATNISTPARVQTNDSIDPFIQSQINRNSR
ncbi:MAG TPA: hypothetical protein VD928_01530, partial [Candidatus Paceibacterota bacterium]|nr:hypothetical protein [Candidatus Paceibacterota bacterium]